MWLCKPKPTINQIDDIDYCMPTCQFTIEMWVTEFTKC